MAQKTSIEWTGATWNPWHGCRKISPGCALCYMYRDKKRYGQDPTKVVRSKTTFKDPLKWDEPQTIFTCSWSDWFIEEADNWRDEAWDIIRATPQHTYQILTKRPERIAGHLPSDWDRQDRWQHVWLGFSAEDQPSFDVRWRHFKGVRASVRWVSLEPLLAPVTLGRAMQGFEVTDWDDGMQTASGGSDLDWVVVGGESGAKEDARPFNVDWARRVVAECAASATPVFVKQLGTNPFVTGRAIDFDGLRFKDWKGGNPAEWPEDLRVRQFPGEVTV